MSEVPLYHFRAFAVSTAVPGFDGHEKNRSETAAEDAVSNPSRISDLVCKAHRLLYHSTLRLRVIKKKKMMIDRPKVCAVQSTVVLQPLRVPVHPPYSNTPSRYQIAKGFETAVLRGTGDSGNTAFQLVIRGNLVGVHRGLGSG